MSLPEIILDDLTWQQTVDAVRTQIAAVSSEEWTLHAPVDPGVTLMELLAYLLEQRVYWLDQISNPLLLALAALLAEEPRGARPARTLMEFTCRKPRILNLIEGEVVERRERASTFFFRSSTSTAILPVERISIGTSLGSRDASRSSTPRWSIKPLTLLPSSGGAGEFAIVFWVGDIAGAAPTQPATLFLDLEVPGVIAPQWSYDAVEARPPAVLQFRYSVAGGGRSLLPESSLHDGTLGLRRSGVIRFDVPADWAPSGPAQNNLVPYALWCSTDRATFSSPPRLLRLAPNVAVAKHERHRSLNPLEVQSQLARWLPLPAMKLQMSDPEPPLEDSIQLRIHERDGQWHNWKAVFDLTRHGPTDRVFLVDRARRRLQFGDGLTGRIPVPDSTVQPALTLEYIGGGGEGANLGPSLFWTVPTMPEVSAINPVPARGGAETETAEIVRARVAASLQAIERAITPTDFETLARSTPGVAVARAHTAVGLHPSFPCALVPGAVTVFIVPTVPRGADAMGELWVPAPQPDPGMLTEVTQRLDVRRLITTEVFVRGPVYRRVAADLLLAGDPVSDKELWSRLNQTLTRYLDPLTGGEDGHGWPFGNPVRPSEIVGRIERVLGEQVTLEHLALQLDGNGPSSDCMHIVIGPHELVWLESLKIEWRPDLSKRGGLR